MIIQLALGLAFALSAPVAAGAIYKWVDAEGTTHYSEKPPPGSKADQLKVAPPPPSSAPGVGEAPPAAKSWREKEAEFQQRRVAEEQARMKREAQEQRSAAQQRRNCILARQNLHALEEQRPVYRIDEKGDRVYIEGKEREEAKQRLRQTVEQNCKSQ
jgi:type IV secretory pathway VirB10-like protein